ncbi:MAG: transcriptional regulator, partial [Marinovum sp.]|nr:transcriptional regulator [Marinovum sp.]
KIRHVPATLPDMFKTDAMLEWEYAPHLGRTIQQAIGASKDRLNWMRESTSDYEIAIPIHEMVSFATSQGYYRDLPTEDRTEQIRWLVDLCDQFYPRVRIYLFDSRRLYSAPVTMFGPLLAVLYVGRHYLAFRDRERVHSFTEHFDALIREASFTTRELEQFFKTHVKS